MIWNILVRPQAAAIKSWFWQATPRATLIVVTRLGRPDENKKMMGPNTSPKKQTEVFWLVIYKGDLKDLKPTKISILVLSA